MAFNQDLGLDYRRWDLFIQTVNFHLDRITRYISTCYMDPTREIWTVVSAMSPFMALVGPYIMESAPELDKMKRLREERVKKRGNKKISLYHDYDLIPIHERISRVKDIVYSSEFIRDMYTTQPKQKEDIKKILKILEITLFDISARLIENDFIPKPKNKSRDPKNALSSEY